MQTILNTALERIGAAQHGVIAHWQAVMLGASPNMIRHRIESGRWRRVRRHVYQFAGVPRTKQSELIAAVLAAGPQGVASHLSAAAVHGIPGFAFGPKEITVPRGVRPQDTGLIVHQSNALTSWHVTIRDSIPATSVARTLFDGCGTWHPRRSERALDNSLSRRMVTLPACWRVLLDLGGHGRAGSEHMRALLLARGDNYVAPESELEARFLELLHDAGLPEPTRQVDVGDADAWIGRVDFIYRDRGLVIETDGRENHSELLDRVADSERDRQLQVSGRRVMRFTWGDITKAPAEVARHLRDALRDVA